jgi:hypothetical protein
MTKDWNENVNRMQRTNVRTVNVKIDRSWMEKEEREEGREVGRRT